MYPILVKSLNEKERTIQVAKSKKGCYGIHRDHKDLISMIYKS